MSRRVVFISVHAATRGPGWLPLDQRMGGGVAGSTQNCSVGRVLHARPVVDNLVSPGTRGAMGSQKRLLRRENALWKRENGP